MTKKEYLIKLMQAIPVDILPIAPNIMSLLEWNQFSDELIDVFYKMFHEYSLTIKDKEKKEVIEKSISFLDKLKQMETADHMQDDKDVSDLEKILENI